MRSRISLSLAACGSSAKRIEVAYDGNYETVFTAARDVVVQRFDKVEASPATRTIKTAWQQVEAEPTRDATSDTMLVNGRERARTKTTTRYFMRFDVTIDGGPPWRVRVLEHARSWTSNAAPAS